MFDRVRGQSVEKSRFGRAVLTIRARPLWRSAAFATLARMKRFAAVALAAAALLGLTGCDQFLPDPLSFTMVDGVVVARTCVPLTISSQTISYFVNDGSYDSYPVWSATGSVSLPAGSEFALESPLEGFTESNEIPPDFYAHNYSYDMQVDAGRGGEWTSSTAIRPGDLTEGAWVDAYGTPIDTPCTHEPCAPMYSCYNNWPQPTGMPTEARPTFTLAPEPMAIPWFPR